VNGVYVRSQGQRNGEPGQRGTGALFFGMYERSRFLQRLYISSIRFAFFIKMPNTEIRIASKSSIATHQGL